MWPYIEFKKGFTKKNIILTWQSKIRFRATPGIDRINKDVFQKQIDNNVNIIRRKVQNGTYKFTAYKEKLISKGRDKYPRLISIPTIRDKITLRILTDILNKSFPDVVFPLVQTLINEVSETLRTNSYDYFIRLDIENFFLSIDHPILIRQLNKRIRKKELLHIIIKAIQTPTISIPSSNGYDLNEKGVPQGLSISNILANIYLNDFDKSLRDSSSFKYVRYVDDMLILCKEGDHLKIKNEIVHQLSNTWKLTVSSDIEKTKHGKITEGFTFLGYTKNENGFTVKESTISKFRDSLSKIFTQFKYSKSKNVEILLWKINLKITGCINEKRKYGWLFFFSQINDLKLLFELDWLVKDYFIKAGLGKEFSKLNVKKFIKAYKEITLNLSSTKYIPNFDSYTLIEKKKLLINIFGQDIKNLKTEQIDRLFKKKIFNSTKDLEKDIQPIS